MTMTDTYDPTAHRLSAEDKAAHAAAWASCPEWCDGVIHEEGTMFEHVGEIGSVGSVSVAVVQIGEQSVGVQVHGEDRDGRNILSGDDLTAFLALVDQARAIVAEAEQA